MRFEHPHFLWLLLVVPPAMVLFFWWALRVRQALMSQFIQARLLPNLTLGISPGRRRLRFAALVGAVCLLIVALARPQWGFVWEEARSRGLDIVVAIDTSKSMLAEDIPPSRLARAKLAALDLLRQAKSDRLGLVAFAGSAFLQCPLTFDEVAFQQSLETLTVDIIPQGGTAIAEAITTAATAFKEDDNHRVLVLFSDGEDHDSGALEAAQAAAKDGMKIYTIGIGSTDGELLKIRNEQGVVDYVRDEEGNVIKTRLNEELLRQVAGATEGGFYLPLRGARTVETLYEEALAKLPKSDREERLVRRYYERFHWPLGLAIALLMFEVLFPERAREPKRRAGATPVRASQATALLLFLLCLCAPVIAQAAPSASSALRDYKAGNYEQALKEYQQLLERRKEDDPRLHYNAGAAAYRSQQFEDAARLFSEALDSPDLQLQESAYHNRGNSMFYLGEQAADPAQRKEAWTKSVQDFQSALKLNPKAQDSQYNLEFVKRRLQELEQQQQQQQQQDQEKNDDSQEQQDNQQQQQQNQQQQQQQQNQNQSQQQQQQQQQQEQDQQQQQQPSNTQPKQEPQEAESQQAGQEDEKAQKKPGQQQAKAASGSEEKDQKDQKPAEQGQMTPEEARRLLDSQKGEEKLLPPNTGKRPSDPRRPIKDW